MSQPPITFHEVPRRAYAAASRTLGVTAHNMAVQDWVVAAFHLYMLLRVTWAPESPQASFAGRFALLLFTVTVCTILLTRGEVLRPGRRRALVYRLGLFVPLLASYFELRTFLPALQLDLLDPELLALDEALFAVTPSVWMAQFNQLPIVEWFAFFYYSYFYILASMVLPALFLGRGRWAVEVLIGAMLICVIGHTTYTLVPGLGPYATLAFDEPLRGGLFLGLVLSTVDRAGAMLDIFPSLHTAYPVFFALMAFRHRRQRPFQYVWPVLAVFAFNMVIATMFLRWHWGIDVVAGLVLAVAALELARAITGRELNRNAGDDPRQPALEPLWIRPDAEDAPPPPTLQPDRS